MAIFPSSNGSRDEQHTFESSGSPTRAGQVDHEKGQVHETNTVLITEEGEESTLAQDGVKKAQATTIYWTRNSLVIAYAL